MAGTAGKENTSNAARTVGRMTNSAFGEGGDALCARSAHGAAMTCGAEPAHGLHMARAGSGLRAGQGRTRKWTSVHDRVITQGCGQTGPARRVALPWPPCGSARLDLPARQALRHALSPDGHGKATRAM